MVIDKSCPLSLHTTIHLGGLCEGYFPETETEMITLVSEFETNGTPYRVVGRMSNILPTDQRAQQKVIFTEKLNHVLFKGREIHLSCGVRFSRIIHALYKDKKVFYPSLIGIPGLVGGMICQNASCFGDEISSNFLFAKVYSVRDGEILLLNREDMKFLYRSSLLKERNYVLLNASFSVFDGDATQTIQNAVRKRKLSMPEGPSLGSVFLRSNDQSIGYLLDRLGQKGRTFGGIAVSSRHAGVLINTGNGTAREYKDAVRNLQMLIQTNFGFIPDCEIEYLN